MSNMLRGYSSLLSLPDISKLNDITIVDYMFSRCSTSIISLPDYVDGILLILLYEF